MIVKHKNKAPARRFIKLYNQIKEIKNNTPYIEGIIPYITENQPLNIKTLNATNFLLLHVVDFYIKQVKLNQYKNLNIAKGEKPYIVDRNKMISFILALENLATNLRIDINKKQYFQKCKDLLKNYNVIQVIIKDNRYSRKAKAIMYMVHISRIRCYDKEMSDKIIMKKLNTISNSMMMTFEKNQWFLQVLKSEKFKIKLLTVLDRF